MSIVADTVEPDFRPLQTLTPAEPVSSPINWKNVRVVYQKLNDDFHILTEPFGITISSQLNEDLAHLIAAIDVIDRNLDEIQCELRRRDFSNAVIRYLSGTNSLKNECGADFNVPEELSGRLGRLKYLICRLDIQSAFCETASKIFDFTEAKRNAKTSTEMMRNLVEEWKLSGHLPVLFLREKSTPEFERFFFQACGMMSAIDMIQDAGSDFQEGNISVRPNVWLYVRLAAIFLVPFPKLLWRFPRKLNLVKYAISFLRLGKS